ncbi:hypothetical protein [Rubellicoccus peritrichatus]|uniref:Uncharacterized protein n=1 Tax=Rubellicoccus peritrichatus TaxID=3080537 RepID=A0AAQ3LCX7_9BACT|nr:hypothetical protein [Puniceicoccus sp. CR14]WOO43400.1 hypothetical protein RZN69_09895 [Puniceicoccus sp. CR14]
MTKNLFFYILIAFVAIGSFIAGRWIADRSHDAVIEDVEMLHLVPAQETVDSSQETLPAQELETWEKFSKFDPRQRKWFVYDMINQESFDLRKGGDWSELRNLLENDLEGTLDTLKQLNIDGGHSAIEVPLYLATYLAERPLSEAAHALKRTRSNDYLHRKTMAQLVVQIDDAGGRENELFGFLSFNPHSLEAQHSAEMIGLRLGDRYEAQSLLEFAMDMPEESARGALISGAVQHWNRNLEEAGLLLSQLDNRHGEFDQAYDYHAGEVAKENPLQGIHWAESVVGEQMRANAAGNVISNWGEYDRPGLIEWLSENPLGGDQSFDRGALAALNQLNISLDAVGHDQ